MDNGDPVPPGSGRPSQSHSHGSELRTEEGEGKEGCGNAPRKKPAEEVSRWLPPEAAGQEGPCGLLASDPEAGLGQRPTASHEAVAVSCCFGETTSVIHFRDFSVMVTA